MRMRMRIIPRKGSGLRVESKEEIRGKEKEIEIEKEIALSGSKRVEFCSLHIIQPVVWEEEEVVVSSWRHRPMVGAVVETWDVLVIVHQPLILEQMDQVSSVQVEEPSREQVQAALPVWAVWAVWAVPDGLQKLEEQEQE